MADGKKIGEVIHFFPKVSVAVVKFSDAVKVGDRVKIKGNRGESREAYEFDQTISSMQKDHNAVEEAQSGDELGVKVDKEVKEGDEVYLA